MWGTRKTPGFRRGGRQSTSDGLHTHTHSVGVATVDRAWRDTGGGASGGRYACVLIMEDPQITSWIPSWVPRPHKTKKMKTLGASAGTATQRQDRDRSCVPKAKEHLQPPGHQETRTDASLETLEEAWPCGLFKFIRGDSKTQL